MEVEPTDASSGQPHAATAVSIQSEPIHIQAAIIQAVSSAVCSDSRVASIGQFAAPIHAAEVAALVPMLSIWISMKIKTKNNRTSTEEKENNPPLTTKSHKNEGKKRKLQAIKVKALTNHQRLTCYNLYTEFKQLGYVDAPSDEG